LHDLGVTVVRSNQFLCHYDDFASWAEGRRQLKMEDFYRWQRRRLGYLMDGDEPAGGRWNYDDENRQRPPKTATPWPEPQRSRLDDLDRAVLDDLPDTCWGAEPDGTWATSRQAALARLRHFVDDVLAMFGPHEDAMVERSWHLAHSVLSPYLNLGLLLPGEVCDAVQDAYDEGRVPIASAEGFIRQVIGWREYVWGVYWLWMPDYRDRNALGADRPLPPVFRGDADTDMNCVGTCMSTLHDHAYNHHIQRLMVLGNLAMLHGVDPWEMTDWMWSSFIDGAEWVMLPNVIGMSQWADGGMMATKPYAAGWQLHRQDERLLRHLPVRPQTTRRRRRLPVHHPVLGLPRAPPRHARAQPAHRPSGTSFRAACPICPPCANAPSRCAAASTTAPCDRERRDRERRADDAADLPPRTARGVGRLRSAPVNTA
jgi:deoxyribodipyrimidine photolyase-related protein